eukprot:TRINITY_DN1076_c0_g2_i4.p3 TRINITY_DN1076_c0_g2~~TRINITY_DN1076_c0_g2_i4.p3  ORF type:complete len:283 (-),score=83.21 TRINITY_DN1076_c0_g2_i4:3263-4111(-)
MAYAHISIVFPPHAEEEAPLQHDIFQPASFSALKTACTALLRDYLQHKKLMQESRAKMATFGLNIKFQPKGRGAGGPSDVTGETTFASCIGRAGTWLVEASMELTACEVRRMREDVLRDEGADEWAEVAPERAHDPELRAAGNAGRMAAFMGVPVKEMVNGVEVKRPKADILDDIAPFSVSAKGVFGTVCALTRPVQTPRSRPTSITPWLVHVSKCGACAREFARIGGIEAQKRLEDALKAQNYKPVKKPSGKQSTLPKDWRVEPAAKKAKKATKPSPKPSA